MPGGQLQETSVARTSLGTQQDRMVIAGGRLAAGRSCGSLCQRVPPGLGLVIVVHGHGGAALRQGQVAQQRL
jgi:hypothetical protein